MQGAIERLQIDTRAQGEVRRLSGGNQQKVTIARWVAGGVTTMLCFDPTRGIDIRTKQQIYVLLRELADAGAAVLLYTSELKEVRLACDRAIVIFGGRVVAELDAADADEPALLRAAYNLKSDALMPEERGGGGRRGGPRQCGGRAGRPGRRPGRRRRRRRPGRRCPGGGPMSATTGTFEETRVSPADAAARFLRDNAWTVGLLILLVALLAFTKLIQPTYGPPGIQGLAIAVLPLALATVGQAIVVISGGIDLSLGSIIAFMTVVAASLMKAYPELTILVVLGVLLLGMVVGAINGGLIVVTRVPDIVVTLAMSFVWAGAALLVLKTPGGAAADWLKELLKGNVLIEWVPKAAVLLIVIVAVIWIPLRRSRLGLSFYAIGSNQLAAFRSGVPVGRTKIASYAFLGLFAALAGLSITANTGQGSPSVGQYTLQSVAAIVLGGVSLAGGRGGVFGPIVAVIILQLIRTDMAFLNINSNLATVANGVILIGVVMLGSLIQIRRERAR